MTKQHVLVVHNAYRHRGGEDSVVDAEIELLRANGHEVTRWQRHNDELATQGRVSIALDTLWSRASHARALELLDTHRPDVVHVHNTFATISPSLYWACAERKVPVVQTLHNFRLVCPQAMLLREGRVCEDCLGRAPWPALQNACYRGSTAQTAVLAGMLMLHRGLGTWRDKITRYIALNEFCRDKFVSAGLPADKLRVKPNFVDFAAPDPLKPRAGLLFVGRLSPEKGIDLLSRALSRSPHTKLRVIGSGPSESTLAMHAGVERLGSQPLPFVREAMERASMLVLPSIWYENFPRTLVEAFATGLPVIASRIGALAELVDHGVTGLLFDPQNPSDLAACMEWALAHPAEVSAMGRSARMRYETLYTPERNYRMLLDIYRDAQAEHD